MSPDQAAQSPSGAAVLSWPAPNAGWLEVALPLWHARWRLLAATLLGAMVNFAISLAQPVRFTGHASFVVQSVQRPSQSAVANALPGLEGLIGFGVNPVDLQLALLQSETIADRIIERFGLRQAWQLDFHAQVRRQLSRRVTTQSGRRDGVISISVEDELPQRAAAMANQYVEELRELMRRFALDEARQRREFYEQQLGYAHASLADAQAQLKKSGFDRAALRVEPRVSAEAYGRMQAEVTAAEVRLDAVRHLRTESSPEVQQQNAELAALRAQLARIERPLDNDPGSYVERVRAYRYAESLVDSMQRQVAAARADEASNPTPLQVLDRALVPEYPSSPRPLLWALFGLLIGFGVVAAWVMLRHRALMAQLDPAYVQRLQQIRAALARKAPDGE